VRYNPPQDAEPSVAPMGCVDAGAVGEPADAACRVGLSAGVRARLGGCALLRIRDHAPVFRPPMFVRAVPRVQRACAVARVGESGGAKTARVRACQHSDPRAGTATTRRAADAAAPTAVHSSRHRRQVETSPPRASCSLLTPDRTAQAACLPHAFTSFCCAAVFSGTKPTRTGGDYANPKRLYAD
jgi:hypothetical protein